MKKLLEMEDGILKAETYVSCDFPYSISRQMSAAHNLLEIYQGSKSPSVL